MCLVTEEPKNPCLNNIWTLNRMDSLHDKNRELSNSLSIIFSQNSELDLRKDNIWYTICIKTQNVLDLNRFILDLSRCQRNNQDRCN